MAHLSADVLADRFDRRILRAWSAGIGLALSLWLAGLAAFGWLDVWSLVNIGFLLQLRASLFTPASEAMLRTVVHKRQLAQAVANNQGRDAAVSLVSGPLGGVLLAWGHSVPFIGQALSFLVMWLTNQRIGGSHKPERTDRSSAWQDLRTGLAFVGSSRLIVAICGAFMLLNLAMNGAVIATIYSLQLAGHRPEVIGLVTAALGIGALLGAVAAGWLVKRVPTGALILACMVVFTAAMGVITAWPELGVVLPALAVVMLTGPAVNAAVGGLLMHVVPNELMGRVQAVLMFLAMLLAPLSPALAGWGIGLVGLGGTYASFGVIGALGLLTCAGFRPIRSLPRMDRWDEVLV